MDVTKEITADPAQVSYCGLYCGACRAFLKGRCPGCAGNEKAGWCKVRTCCLENGHTTCADCEDHADPMNCKKFNNFVAKIFQLVFGSNRAGSIAIIRREGLEGFARAMAATGRMTPPRR